MSHLLSDMGRLLFNAPHQSEVETSAQTVLQEQRRAAAVQTTLRDDGHTVTQQVSFIHVVCGQDHCTA